MRETATTDRVCAALTACTANEYQRLAPTIQTDRVCATLTQCNVATTYISTPHTATTDRVCTPRTQCVAGVEYEVTAGSATADRVCARVSSCQVPLEFQAQAATATSDAVCRVVAARCDGRTQYELRPPSRTTDRVCVAVRECGANEYQTQPPGESVDRVCTPLSTCQLGATFASVAATATTDRQCSAVRPCTAGAEFAAQLPTLTNNTVCQALTACRTGRPAFLETACTACAGFGFPLSTACAQAVADSVCNGAEPQPDFCDACGGVLNPGNPNDSCLGPGLAWVASECEQNYEQYAVRLPTATTDRQCATTTVCGAGQVEIVPPRDLVDRLCGVAPPTTPTTPAPSTTTVPDQVLVGSGGSDDSGTAWWVWVVIAAAAVVIVLVAFVLLRKTSRVRDYPVEGDETYWAHEDDRQRAYGQVIPMNEPAYVKSPSGNGKQQRPPTVVAETQFMAYDDYQPSPVSVAAPAAAGNGRKVKFAESNNVTYEAQPQASPTIRLPPPPAFEEPAYPTYGHGGADGGDADDILFTLGMAPPASATHNTSAAAYADYPAYTNGPTTGDPDDVLFAAAPASPGPVKNEYPTYPTYGAADEADPDSVLFGAAATAAPAPEKTTTRRAKCTCQRKVCICRDSSGRALEGDVAWQDTPASPRYSGLEGTLPVGDMSGSIKDIQLQHLRAQLAAAGEQFAQVQRETKGRGTFTVGQRPENKVAKNRYGNIFANDQTRVKLANDGYINANHVRFPNAPDEFHYVAAQGPKPETLDDFWQMVVREQASAIVMLTELETETGQVKCEQYWPAGLHQARKFGNVTVTLTAETRHGGFVERQLRVSSQGRARVVTHLQLLDWPDHGVPADPGAFLELLAAGGAASRAGGPGPALVHCSAGIGRTGVYMVVDIALSKLADDLLPDLPTILTRLRSHCAGLIQNQEQFAFCYTACLAAVERGLPN